MPGYDAELTNRVRAELGGLEVTEKSMFGGLAFLINGHMGVTVGAHGGLMVRVPPEETEQLLGEPGTSRVVMGKRAPMTGWLRVSPEALDDDAALTAWVRRGVDYASSLPPKR